jgi:hypothetical protein
MRHRPIPPATLLRPRSSPRCMTAKQRVHDEQVGNRRGEGPGGVHCGAVVGQARQCRRHNGQADGQWRRLPHLAAKHAAEEHGRPEHRQQTLDDHRLHGIGLRETADWHAQDAVPCDLQIPRRECGDERLAFGVGHRTRRDSRCCPGLKPDEPLPYHVPRLRKANPPPTQQGMLDARPLIPKQQQELPVAPTADGETGRSDGLQHPARKPLESYVALDRLGCKRVALWVSLLFEPRHGERHARRQHPVFGRQNHLPAYRDGGHC